MRLRRAGPSGRFKKFPGLNRSPPNTPLRAITSAVLLLRRASAEVSQPPTILAMASLKPGGLWRAHHHNGPGLIPCCFWVSLLVGANVGWAAVKAYLFDCLHLMFAAVIRGEEGKVGLMREASRDGERRSVHCVLCGGVAG